LIDAALTANDDNNTRFQDLTTPSPKLVNGIPICNPKKGISTCTTFAYVPAPSDAYEPSAATLTGATGEVERVHRVVKGIMTNNRPTILTNSVLGFTTVAKMEAYMAVHTERVAGAYVFSSPSSKNTTFLLSLNTTVISNRGEFIDHTWARSLPMQVAASREITRQLIFNDNSLPYDVSIQEFAHPAFQKISWVGLVGPIFFIAAAMFPFVIQMQEQVFEKEQKLRQSMSSMGMHEAAYHLSWHLYQTLMAVTSSLLLTVFGIMFGFDAFTRNSFFLIFFTFWFFQQAMIGYANLIGSCLKDSASAVTMGFAVFFMAFIFYFVILFGFPYGTYKVELPFSYNAAGEGGNLLPVPAYKESGTDPYWLWFFAILCPSNLFVKAISDLGTLTATASDPGLSFGDRDSYCEVSTSVGVMTYCDSSYDIGSMWGIWILEYFVFSTLGLYLDAILPDAMGMQKSPWFFLTPAFWGCGDPSSTQRQVVAPFPPTLAGGPEASLDEDVLGEEALILPTSGGEMLPNSAIEVRGLVQTFQKHRGMCKEEAFNAVKGPWFRVEQNSLFTLLGPNGAGKTTTINMLTGVLQPTAGDALVLDDSIVGDDSMNRIKQTMGVCPQFDILWEGLTAREHLRLFAVLKGVSGVEEEINERVEEVKLGFAADQLAGNFSGGMRRRLSVAVALIGDPAIVYLDEPTTGMDPINRRHVWDVIQRAKQERTVVLTTHSMEEADILSDRIAIMCKGRLRCIGSSVRLKSKFGSGYKVAVSVGDQILPGDPTALGVKAFFREELSVEPLEENKAYMFFAIPNTVENDQRLPVFFTKLETQREELGIVDVQVGMSTLEDVFLEIATKTEREEAERNNRTTTVTLPMGEEAEVLLGAVGPQTAPSGVQFEVKWGTDEVGNLDAVDIVVLQHSLPPSSRSSVPPSASDNDEGKDPTLKAPDELQVHPLGVNEPSPPLPIGVQSNGNGDGGGDDLSVSIPVGKYQIQERMETLQTTSGMQMRALFKKNAAFQGRRTCAVCCMICSPIFFILLMLMLQFLINNLFLSTPERRCPYCGPGEPFAGYCKEMDCAEFFFSSQPERKAACTAWATNCTGNACYKREWASSSQSKWCPWDVGQSQPVLMYLPGDERSISSWSENPVLYTGQNMANADNMAAKIFAPQAPVKKLESAAYGYGSMYTALMGTTVMGCAGTTHNITNEVKQALCALFSPHGSSAQCCADMTATGKATLKANVAQNLGVPLTAATTAAIDAMPSANSCVSPAVPSGIRNGVNLVSVLASGSCPAIDIRAGHAASWGSGSMKNGMKAINDFFGLVQVYPSATGCSQKSSAYLYNTTGYCACNMLSVFSPSNSYKGGIFSTATLPEQTPANLFSDPSVTSGSSVWANNNIWTDNALRFDQSEASDSNKGRPWPRSGKGDVRVISSSCPAMPSQTCFLKQESALAGLGGLGCANASSLWMSSVSAVNAAVHKGYYDEYGDNMAKEQADIAQYILGVDYRDTDATKVKVSVMYNDTRGDSTRGPPRLQRYLASVKAVLQSHLAQFKGEGSSAILPYIWTYNPRFYSPPQARVTMRR